MALLKLSSFRTDSLIAENGQQHIQLTRLDSSGALWTLGPRGWIAISMEIMTTEQQAKAMGIEIVQ